MLAMSSSDVRKEWSGVMDKVVRHGPVMLRRNRDYMMLCSDETISQIVEDVTLEVQQFTESDGSVTLSAQRLDLVVNGEDFQTALAFLVRDWVEYAEEYFQDFSMYSHAPNRKGHLPYVMKAITAQCDDELEGAVVCRPGKS